MSKKPGSSDSLSGILKDAGLKIDFQASESNSAEGLISQALKELQEKEKEEKLARARTLVQELATQTMEVAKAEKEWEKKRAETLKALEKKKAELINFCKESGISTEGVKSTEDQKEEPKED